MMVGKNGKDARDATEVKDLKDLAKQLDSFKRDAGAELRDLKESMDFFSKACDGVQGLMAEIAALRKEVKKLTKSKYSLEAENARLSLKVNEIEQYQRMNNLEIKCNPDESEPVEIIKQLGEVIGETIQEYDVDTCHWVPTAKQGERNIIVRFVRRSKRNAVLAKLRKTKEWWTPWTSPSEASWKPWKPPRCWRTTVLVFSSDNGATLFSLGGNWPLRGLKGSLWEGAIRAAGFVWSPRLENRGRVSQQLMHISDWLAYAVLLRPVSEPNETMLTSRGKH
ncbi:hypothetical protein HPB48_006354 [Haemaphysalis longicornis]|uniref:Sulfatase N-terminal domain-containing protein n=1 Tax=Haemaphysalis longicornis TaxID=44386 RepID=A0A9J6GZC0_HAELO|nr:hypothetical protein HPB48_006354 [Haemaphysalis longicornis]